MLVDDRLVTGRQLDEMIDSKFGDNDTLESKYDPKVPPSADREYRRLINEYMGIAKNAIESELSAIKPVYKEERDASVHTDGLVDFQLAIEQAFGRIQNQIVKREGGFGLRRKLENMANLNRKLTIEEWKKACHATLGIDIREDYYMGDFYNEMLDEWVDYNADRIKNLPDKTAAKVRDVIYDGYTNGETTTDLIKDIRRVFKIDKRRARLIARDQTAKLNGSIQRAQQMDAGITQYKWSTSGDERVRKSHRELEDKIFEWDNPPLNSDGRRCHPAQDYQCRCIGRPIFSRNDMRLPVYVDTSDDLMSSMIQISGVREKPLQKAFKSFRNALIGSPGYDEMKQRLIVAYDTAEAVRNTGLEVPYAFNMDDGKLYYNPTHDNFSKYDVNYALSHELTHLIDYYNLQSYANYDFVTTINQASYDITLSDAVDWVGVGGKYEGDEALCDILSALSHGAWNSSLPIGHPDSYWDDMMVPMEILANLASIDIIGYKSRQEPKLQLLFEVYRRLVSWVK